MMLTFGAALVITIVLYGVTHEIVTRALDWLERKLR